MDLRSYWQILKRRWIYVIGPVAIVLILGLITYDKPATNYNAGIRFIVGQEPTIAAIESDEERLANWKTSEYVVNTLADWVKGGQFAQLVSEDLSEDGIVVAPQAIVGGTTSDSTRSMMVLSITYFDPLVLEQIMQAAADVLINQNELGLPQLGGETAQLVQLDEPIVNSISASIINQLDLPLRIALAFFAGIGLAFLVEYLDPTIRNSDELELMELPVIGLIPGNKKGWGDILPRR
jgi:capsular polysaccharide biosynthesis protein